MIRTALIIPTFNGGDLFAQLLRSLEEQTYQPQAKIVIDSGSSDGTAGLAEAHGFKVRAVAPQEFNHGTTRQLGLVDAAEAEFLIYLTQDAVLADKDSLAKLLAAFDDGMVGVVYGRQLPRPGAGPIEAHARLFNYSGQSRIKSMEDAPALGIKTPFSSDSFAAYRRKALEEVGGFPEGVIQSEDMYVAAKMLLAGWKNVYCAEAVVYHSHALSYRQEFRRYFDTGVFHARNPWIRQQFGGAGGEGRRFVQSQLGLLLRRHIWLIPSAVIRTAIKAVAFQMGLKERRLPVLLKTKISHSPGFWLDR